MLTLEGLFFNIKRLLKNHGEFFVISPEERLNETFSYIYKNNLQIINMDINEYRKKKLIMIYGKKGGKINSGIEVNYKKLFWNKVNIKKTNIKIQKSKNLKI